MSIKERSQDLHMVAELLRIHLPKTLHDPALCKDICAVIGINLRRIATDVENSAKAWDKRTYHSKADALRRENEWVTQAAEMVEVFAYSPKRFDADDLARLNRLVPANLELLQRPRFKNLENLRGAATAARKNILKK
jgi:hypothetical protein